ncbi:MAG: DUF2723 domain-containing protein [Chloroflexota bacterium]
MLSSVTRQQWAGLALLLLAALLYLSTLDTGLRPDELTGGDLITHQYAQVEGRPSNAPGYPLYTMGGWLWFRLGRATLFWLLNPVQILSFYSTLWALGSLLILYVMLLKSVRLSWPSTFLLTLFYATTFFFWYYSVTTEQYTSATFQTLLMIWFAFRWDETSYSDRKHSSILLWLAFLSGTMLANMVTTLFILPPLLWFIFFKQVDEKNRSSFLLGRYLKRPGLIFQAIGVTLLPLLSYVYIYIRGAQHPEWRGEGEWATAWDWFIQFITIQQGRDELGPGLTFQTAITDEFPLLMAQELTWLVLIGGLIGIAALGKRRAIFLYSTLIIYMIFCFGYRFGNWFQVIIPAYPMFVIGFAAGLKYIGGKLDTAGKQSSYQWLTLIVLIGLLGYRFSTNLNEANQRFQPEDTGLNAGWAILADNPSPPARIVSNFEEWVALQYLQIVWRAAPGVDPVDATRFKADDGTVSTYISRQATALVPEIINSDTIYPRAIGQQLIALEQTPQTVLGSQATPLTLDFGDTIKLAGWHFVDAPPEKLPIDQANWAVALYWQASNPVIENYIVSVRPLSGGQLIHVDDAPLIQDHEPVWGVYPTSRWRPDEIIRDIYALSLPETVTPDSIQIILYKTTETGFENLGVHVVSTSQ